MQCSSREGAPLYPVAKIFLSLTRTAPTCMRRQVERLATRWVISMKYSSQLGRVIRLLRWKKSFKNTPLNYRGQAYWRMKTGGGLPKSWMIPLDEGAIGGGYISGAGPDGMEIMKG